ncbi:MAG: hypothetical protein ACREFW_04365, partial [Rhizomicrobium sp.]
MNRIFLVALAAVGFAATSGQAGADGLRVGDGLTRFDAGPPISSASALPAWAVQGPFSGPSLSQAPARLLQTRFGTVVPPRNFAASVPLSANLAMDTGYNVDLSQRFESYDGFGSPLIGEMGYTGLASGGHYLGATYMPAETLHVRLGVSQWDDKYDRMAFDPGLNLPPAFDNARSQSLLAGVSWDLSDWADLGLTALRNSQRGLGAFANLTPQTTLDTNALDMAA